MAFNEIWTVHPSYIFLWMVLRIDLSQYALAIRGRLYFKRTKAKFKLNLRKKLSKNILTDFIRIFSYSGCWQNLKKLGISFFNFQTWKSLENSDMNKRPGKPGILFAM